jgi:predicted nucleotidyltransferase/predicted transcriptional regulator
VNINQLFSTRERIKILNHVIYKTGYLNVNKVAKNVELSKGLVSKYFKHLTREGVLEKKDDSFLVQSSVNTRAVKILLNLNLFDMDLFRKHGFIKGAGIYGSYVKGINTEDSDIDLWVITEETSEEDLAKLTCELKNFGDVRPLYLSKDKLELLRKEDPTFYHSLVFGSITIHGDDIEAF